MAVHAGRHPFGTDRGRILLRTLRDGLAAQAGHDLTMEATQWSGELTADDSGSPTGLEVRTDMGSLVVVEGSGGIKPLTGKDKREIAATTRKVLGADRHPDATFRAAEFRPRADDSGIISGSLTLAGRARPARLQVSRTGADACRAATSIVQSDFGITPYRAFLGSLKVRDAVNVEVLLDLSDHAEAAP
jgi:hypothetical protein